jgi:hypothetical protein
MTLYRLARREHKLENQASVAIFDKGITIIYILRLDLNS